MLQRSIKYFAVSKPRNRPSNRELQLAVEQLAISYLLIKRRFPTAPYKRKTRRHDSDFVRFALPHLKDAGYADDEKRCARQIQSYLSSARWLQLLRSQVQAGSP